MESNKGYVYIMMNPSYNGMIKVGKTTKDPDERAKELSSATGVATPFIVVFKRLFNNCHTAEKIAHGILEERGCRVNDSREFFAIDIPDAINVILQIPDEEYYEEDDDLFEGKEEIDEDLGEYFYDMGEKYYFGYDDTFVDEDVALLYYEKSASLGYSRAYEKMGEVWEGKDDERKALSCYKEGVNNSCFSCYAKLGRIYMRRSSEFYHEDNANLAWKKYFEYLDVCSEYFLTVSDVNEMFIGYDLYSYVCQYFLIDKNVPTEHTEFLLKYKYEIIGILEIHARKMIKYNDGDIAELIFDQMIPALQDFYG